MKNLKNGLTLQLIILFIFLILNSQFISTYNKIKTSNKQDNSNPPPKSDSNTNLNKQTDATGAAPKKEGYSKLLKEKKNLEKKLKETEEKFTLLPIVHI